jgi:TonB-dependent receptor
MKGVIYLTIAGLVVCSSGLLKSYLQAQEKNNQKDERYVSSINNTTNLLVPSKLPVLVYIDFKDVTLRTALQTLAEKGNINLVFSDDDFAFNRLVTMSLRGLTVPDALKLLLAGSGLDYFSLESGGYVIGSQQRIAQEFGVIRGKVIDASSKQSLPGANVLIKGTTIGAASNTVGDFTIQRVPAGDYILVASYLGYERKEMGITVHSGEIVDLEIELEWIGVLLDEIAITAQAAGQMEAINRQLASSSIVSVVSSARMQELPDATAAESIGRLPGVYITRVGGEGSQVVVRGLEPKHNAITIDGIRMASSNRDDRGVDLSMISSDMLETIEVYKTITADQDAGALGGTVNFRLRQARGGRDGMGISLQAQGGYTGLPNAYDKYNNYKIVPTLENRFFEERLGVLLQANIERRNLASNEIGTNYRNRGADEENYLTQSINLHNIGRNRDRVNAAVLLDYKLPAGLVSFSNFYSSGVTEIIDRNQNLIINEGPGARNQHIYALTYSKGELNMMSNTVRLERDISIFNLNFRLSHNYSETNNPDDWQVTFYQSPAGLTQFDNVDNLDPRIVNEAVFTDPDAARLHTILSTESVTKERIYEGGLDVDVPVKLSQLVNMKVKFGGLFRSMDRSFDAEVYSTNATFISPSARGAVEMIRDYFGIESRNIPLSFFVNQNFDFGKFLDGEYFMHNPMHFGMAKDLIQFARDNVDGFAASGAREAFAPNNYLSRTNDYSGEERLWAGYIMTPIDIGSKLTVIPGVRFQNLQTSYSGVRGQQAPLSYQIYDHRDTTITVNHPYWLPNLNIRYKLTAWFDIRCAYSHTISYPDFTAIIPRIDVTTGASLAWNNFNLKPSRSKNYDLFFSFYENRIGLFTIGGFLKQIENLIYPWTFNKAGLEAAPYYLPYRQPAAHLTYNISTFVNSPYRINNWGLELDWQTHFWYLPNPLKGLVLNINYTYGYSTAEYPFIYAGATSATDIDTSFTDRLLYQPNHIVNFSIGYDYKDFSVRVSMLYYDDVFAAVSQWPQLRASTASYTRWDVSFRQKLPWFGLQIFGDINNINGEKDLNVLQMYPAIPLSSETYGMMANLGIRWQL